MHSSDEHGGNDGPVKSARVVRLKSFDEMERGTPDLQVQAALEAVSQASSLIDRMRERCSDIERQAEAYVYQARDDLKKARGEIAILEERLAAAEGRAVHFQAINHANILQIRDLELKLKDLEHEKDVAQTNLRNRDDAVQVLQSAIKQHLSVSLKGLDGLSRSKLDEIGRGADLPTALAS